MIKNFGEIAFTPAVKAAQERLGSRKSYARFEGVERRNRLTAEESEFIAARDSFYLATVGENGWPYVQFRGGPKGFLRMLDERTLGFADFTGNRQYISLGNIAATQHACLFLMDYPNQFRLKIWAEARVSEEPELIARLQCPGYPARASGRFCSRSWRSTGIASSTSRRDTRWRSLRSRFPMERRRRRRIRRRRGAGGSSLVSHAEARRKGRG